MVLKKVLFIVVFCGYKLQGRWMTKSIGDSTEHEKIVVCIGSCQRKVPSDAEGFFRTLMYFMIPSKE